MFNWYTLPTFAVMLLFWLLAAYVLTRSPRSGVSIAAVAAQVAAAAYLLGQGMQANALTVDEWRPWARNLLWGATLAPTLWYWLTVLLLREQPDAWRTGYVRQIAVPLGVAFAIISIVLTVAIYIDDWLLRWSAPVAVPATQFAYSHYDVKVGPLQSLFLALLVATTVAAAFNVGVGWRSAREAARRRRFALLFVSAMLFIVSANTLGLANSLDWTGDWVIGVSHVVLGVAMLAMVWNVAAYNLLLRGQVMRRDASFFLTSLAVICLVYALAMVLIGRAAYSFQALSLFVILLILAILSHSFVDVGRRALDPLFFGRDVQLLRSNLTSVVQDAALAPDLGPVLAHAQREIDEVSTEHFIRLTEEALRRINSPAALARCALLDLVPRTLRTLALELSNTELSDPTPLRQARALRDALSLAIDRLKPGDVAGPSAGTLQYQILFEEYVQGLPNKQIMLRHSISESTFHRNRREAIAVLARELQRQEDLFPLP